MAVLLKQSAMMQMSSMAEFLLPRVQSESMSKHQISLSLRPVKSGAPKVATSSRLLHVASLRASGSETSYEAGLVLEGGGNGAGIDRKSVV